MVEEGALPQDVDRVLEDFGMPMGSFKVSDLSGKPCTDKVWVPGEGHSLPCCQQQAADSPTPLKTV